MEIVLCVNYSEPNKVGKNIVASVTLTGTLRKETSVLDPVILVEGNKETPQILSANYMQIPDFERSYFITNMVSIRSGLWEVHAHVDVLETYAAQIKALDAVVARQENTYNLYISDEVFMQQQNSYISTQKFPNGFQSPEYVLVVTGG